MKRVLDIIMAVIGLLIGGPVMLVIAILLRIDSPGDTFFSQKRLGKNRKIFKIYKFRKFPQNWGAQGSGVTTQNDVRMTAFGAFLERTKLDELPQLWNILKGEMSFVGPRPESIRYQDLFTGKFDKLLDFTPGIFGPNQVAFRNESEMYPTDQDPDEFYRNELFPQKAENDISYFSNATLLSDIKWIFVSVFGVVAGIFDWQRVYRRYSAIVALDFVLFELAWFVAHLFRFSGFDLSEANYQVYITGCWLIPVIIFPLMLFGGCYRHPIRYFGLSDVVRIIIVGGASWVVAVFIQFGFFQRNLSVGIALLGLFLFFAFIIFPRLWRREAWLFSNPPVDHDLRSILICGAGQKGNALAKFLDKGFDNTNIVGFLDEDAELRGRYLNGLKVLGSWRDRESVFSRHGISELWVSDVSEYIDEDVIEQWSNDKGIKYVSLQRI